MPDAPLPLRAHNVLCLHGFRGEGYSEAFIEHMREVRDRLEDDPAREILLRAAPDTLCEACPHLADGGCTLGGRGHEAQVRAQDVEVLRRLGCEEGEIRSWGAVTRRIAAAVRGSDLKGLCGACPWLSLGWCAEGIDALAARRAEQA